MRALVLVAHADDEVLGCGGAIQRLLAVESEVTVVIASDGRVAPGRVNVQAAVEAARALGLPEQPYFLGLPDQRFELAPVAEIADAVAELVDEPDLVLTHSAGDLNRDHRIVAEAAQVFGRKASMMIAAEVPGARVRPFRPQVAVVMDEEQISRKVGAFAMYLNEVREPPDPRSLEGLRTLARLRGYEVGVEYAEAYEVIRATL